MRLNLRLRGTTGDGKACRADVSVYAKGPKDLQKQADHAARTAAWEYADPPHDPVPEGSKIVIEHVDKI